jgi:hypothetical protein
MCIYEMSAFPDIFLRGNTKKKNMSMSPTGPVGRILPTLSAVGDMSATCRRPDSDISLFWAPTMSCRFRQLPTCRPHVRRN